MSFQTFIDEPDHIDYIRNQIRRFIEENMPREKRIEWDKKAIWPRDVYAKFNEMGLTGLAVPEEYGGAGIDLVAAIAVIEELSRGGMVLAGPYIHTTFYGGVNLSHNGSDEQKAEYLPRIAAGEMFLSYGLSEPDIGGDLASVKTHAVLSGDKVIINGAKRWCTGANWSDYVYCLVRSGDSDARYKNLSFVLIPTDAPGITMHDIEHSNIPVSYTHLTLPTICSV